MVNKYSNAEKAQELRREIGMRRHVYPKKVAEGKMTGLACDRLIALAEAMLADYEALAAADTPDMFAEPAQERTVRQMMDDNRNDMRLLEQSLQPTYQGRPISSEEALEHEERSARYNPTPDLRGHDPTYNKTPGRLIERGGKFESCRCGDKILRGLVKDAMTGTLNTRIWDATPTTHDGQNYYTKHRCAG